MNRIILIIVMLYSHFLFAAPEWKQIANEDGISIYSRPSESGIIPFKAKGVLNHNIENILAALQDDKNKAKWSPKLKSVRIHEKLNNNQFIFSEYYKTPWPAYDREFLLLGSIEKVSNSHYILSAKSVVSEELSDEDHVQVDVKYLNIVLKSNTDSSTTIYFEFFGDMKGFMPTWLMNLIQKKWPMRFIVGLDQYLLNQ